MTSVMIIGDVLNLLYVDKISNVVKVTFVPDCDIQYKQAEAEPSLAKAGDSF